MATERGSAEPIPGRCGRQLRNTSPPRYCTQRPRKGRSCCGLHGGDTPIGPASARWVTGERSKWLGGVPVLGTAYAQALANPGYGSLRDLIAQTDANIDHCLSRLQEEPDLARDAKFWAEVREFREERRKLTETEGKNLAKLGQVVPVADIEQVWTQFVLVCVKPFVDMETLRKMTAAARALFVRGVEAVGGGGDDGHTVDAETE